MNHVSGPPSERLAPLGSFLLFLSDWFSEPGSFYLLPWVCGGNQALVSYCVCVPLAWGVLGTLPLFSAASLKASLVRLTWWDWAGLLQRIGFLSFFLLISVPISSLTVRLHDSISEEGFHYLVFDL